MPTRAEVRLLQYGQAEVARMARTELAAWWAMLDKSDLDALREEVLWFFPTLVEEYGNVAATVAADWYEEICQERASMEMGLDTFDKARARARWAIGESWNGKHAESLRTLELVADEMVRQFGRDSVTQSAAANNRRYARVPAGAETCAFCLMVASRGFAYHSAQTAGEMAKFHSDCDCQIVPDNGVVPDGYDPDRLYEMYRSVNAEFGDATDVTRALREKFGLK